MKKQKECSYNGRAAVLVLVLVLVLQMVVRKLGCSSHLFPYS